MIASVLSRRWRTRQLPGVRAWIGPRRLARLRRWGRPRRLIGVVVVAGVLMGGAIASSVIWVDQQSRAERYDTVDQVPARPVAVVFGNKVHPTGVPATILTRRLDTAKRLYQAGRVRAILVSGDAANPTSYNEVDPMRRWLIDRGVPASKVIGDPAGVDTYDSCVRAVTVFGVRSAILVTQNYHLARAVTLCRKVGMDAVGVAAGTRGVSAIALHRRVMREDVACVKAVLDGWLRPDPQRGGRPDPSVSRAIAQP